MGFRFLEGFLMVEALACGLVRIVARIAPLELRYVQ
jgi:hypothetical protein